MLRRREIAEKAAKQNAPAIKKSDSSTKNTSKSAQKEKKQIALKISAAEKRLEAIETEMQEFASDYVRLAELYDEKESLETELLELYELYEG